MSLGIAKGRPAFAQKARCGVGWRRLLGVRARSQRLRRLSHFVAGGSSRRMGDDSEPRPRQRSSRPGARSKCRAVGASATGSGRPHQRGAGTGAQAGARDSCHHPNRLEQASRAENRTRLKNRLGRLRPARVRISPCSASQAVFRVTERVRGAVVPFAERPSSSTEVHVRRCFLAGKWRARFRRRLLGTRPKERLSGGP